MDKIDLTCQLWVMYICLDAGVIGRYGPAWLMNLRPYVFFLLQKISTVLVNTGRQRYPSLKVFACWQFYMYSSLGKAIAVARAQTWTEAAQFVGLGVAGTAFSLFVNSELGEKWPVFSTLRSKLVKSKVAAPTDSFTGVQFPSVVFWQYDVLVKNACETISLVTVCLVFLCTKLLDLKFLKNLFFPFEDLSLRIVVTATAVSLVQDVAALVFVKVTTGYDFSATFSAPFARHNRFLHMVVSSGTCSIFYIGQILMSFELGAEGAA